jgi:hypothetical protein
MNYQKTREIVALLEKQYPTISIQELFGGIRMDCGKRWRWIDEFNAEDALTQAHAFAQECITAHLLSRR